MDSINAASAALEARVDAQLRVARGIMAWRAEWTLEHVPQFLEAVEISRRQLSVPRRGLQASARLQP